MDRHEGVQFLDLQNSSTTHLLEVPDCINNMNTLCRRFAAFVDPYADGLITVDRASRNHVLLWVRCDSDHHVCVAFQYLDNFPCLQIPKVDLVVLASRQYPLPPCHAEAGRDAVLGILVSDVGLQTARRMVVPEPDRAIVRCREDVF